MYSNFKDVKKYTELSWENTGLLLHCKWTNRYIKGLVQSKSKQQLKSNLEYRSILIHSFLSYHIVRYLLKIKYILSKTKHFISWIAHLSSACYLEIAGMNKTSLK